MTSQVMIAHQIGAEALYLLKKELVRDMIL